MTSSMGANDDEEGVLDGDELLDRFDMAWRSGNIPCLKDFLARVVGSTGRRSLPVDQHLLEAIIKLDLNYRWRSRVKDVALPAPPVELPWRPHLEDYVKHAANLGWHLSISPALIGEEYWVRHMWGDRPTHDEFLSRFCEFGAEVKKLLNDLDAEVKAERADGSAVRNRGGPEGSMAKEDAGSPQTPIPSLTSVAEFIATLREQPILKKEHLSELLQGDLPKDFPEPRTLARELLRREWLTPFQVNQILQGRGTQLILGAYLLLERLGEGGAGQVFKARHLRLHRMAALKVIRKELLSESEVVDRFYREVRIISQLNHPNVISAFDAGVCGSQHFLAMEYVSGTDLGKLVKQYGPLSAELACDYIRQAAVGLQHAFERGLVHRDLKPHNLLLTGGKSTGQDPLEHVQTVKIADFGLARIRYTPISDDVTQQIAEYIGSGALTPRGAVMLGTPDYMAPEQAIDFHQADIRSDIYSLGCTLFYLLTGRAPFSGGSLAEKLAGHLHQQPPLLTEIRPDLPSSLNSLMQRLLAKQPSQRFQTPAEVAALLTKPALLSQSLGIEIPSTAAAQDTGIRTVRLVGRPEHPAGTSVSNGEDGVAPQSHVFQRRWLLAGVTGAVFILGGLWLLISGKQHAAPKEQVFDKTDIVKAKPKSPGVDQKWIDATRLLPAPEQLERVRAKLVELNPGFNGKLNEFREGDSITRLAISTDCVDNIAPLAALTSLYHLSFDGGPGQGKLADLTPLKGLPLKTFFCTHNRVANLGPLQDMPLRIVRIHSCPVADLRPLAGKSQLEHLALARCNQITDESVLTLGDLRGLIELNLNSTRITGNGLMRLSGEHLQKLSLVDTQITDEGMKEVGRFKQLRTLDLGSAKMTDEGFKELVRLPALQELNLGDCEKITNEGLKEAGNIKKLQTLSFGHMVITGAETLAECSNLKTLILGPSTKVTETGLAALRGARPDLIIDDRRK